MTSYYYDDPQDDEDEDIPDQFIEEATVLINESDGIEDSDERDERINHLAEELWNQSIKESLNFAAEERAKYRSMYD